MARIRTIKPEFPQSQSMGRVSRDARLLFVLLWTIADDSGRTRAASRMLASLLFPYDDDAPKKIDGWLAELERENCIALYRVDGNDYLQVCNWASHQKIDNASKPKFPALDKAREEHTSPREEPGLDQGPRTKDQGEERERAPAREPRSSLPPKPDDVPEAVWRDWLAVRKGKRAAVTETAVDRIRVEAKSAGMLLADALAMATANGWQGFRADWVKRDGAKSMAPRLVATSTQHIPNMPLGHANCSCAGCVSFREKRAQ